MRHRRLAYDSPVRYVRCICLGGTLPYLAPQTPPSPLRIRLCLYNISYCSIIELPIHISPHIMPINLFIILFTVNSAKGSYFSQLSCR